MAANISILIPAAGSSLRMRGRDKLMEPVGGEALLHRSARIACATGAKVIVTLPDSGPHAAARRAALVGLPVSSLPIRDYQDGMSASIRAGVRAAGMAEGLMIHLPDMPDLETEDLTRIIAAFARDPSHPVRGATDAGQPGHPVILPRRLFSDLLVLSGDRGAQRVLEGMALKTVALAGDRALTDLDTPEDWEAWRSAR